MEPKAVLLAMTTVSVNVKKITLLLRNRNVDIYYIDYLYNNINKIIIRM